jgi:hypothetical protein
MNKPLFVKTSEGYINLALVRWIEDEKEDNAMRF